MRESDFSVPEPRNQVLRGKIDKLDLLGCKEHSVRDGLGNLNARSGRHGVALALQFAYVEGRPNLDAGFDQLQNVLPALSVPVRACICVREVVDDKNLGGSSKSGIQVKLAA